MKKVVLSFLLIGTCALSSHAQLKVFQNGNTAAKSTLTTSTVGLSVGNKTYGSDYSVYMSASNPAAATYNIGAEGWAYPSTARTTGRTIGVRGVAGNCADGYNYGIMGVLQGGAVVFGGGVIELNNSSIEMNGQTTIENNTTFTISNSN